MTYLSENRELELGALSKLNTNQYKNQLFECRLM